MNVKLIRMWSGEDVIADIVEDNSDSIVITDPIVAVPSPQQGNIAFAPWSPCCRHGRGRPTGRTPSAAVRVRRRRRDS